MGKTLLLPIILSIGIINHLSGQFSFSLTTGLTHSDRKITNVSTNPNILFFQNDDIIEFENLKLLFDGGVSYQFKNGLSVGLRYGKTLIDFSYSLIDLRVGSGSIFKSGGDFIPYLHTFIAKDLGYGRWKLSPYLGLGYRWSAKSNYLAYDKKILSSGFGSSTNTNPDGSITKSMSETNTDYLFPQIFLPIGINIKYKLAGRFSLLSNLDYQYGFNKPFTRQEVMYQDILMPESSGLGIIERKNIISLNLGLGYTFEEVKPNMPNKKRKTLKKKKI